MISFDYIYPTKNQSNVGVNEDIKLSVSADFELDPRDVVFMIHGVAIIPEIYSVYYGNTTSKLDITLYTKQRVKYATERRYGQDNFRYGMRDVYPSMLNYGMRYVVEVKVFGINNNNEYEEKSEIFAFSTEEGIFKNPNPADYYYSTMTQSIANFFPEWSKTRFDKYSNIQQLMNPIGENMELISDFLRKQNANTFIQTCNLNELSVLHKIELGRDYPIQQLVAESGDSYYVQPEIKAIQDITEYELFAKPENSFKEFYYNQLPTRIDNERDQLDQTYIVENMTVGSNKVEIDYELKKERELYLVVSNFESSIHRDRDVIRLIKVRINGINEFDDKVSEDIPIIKDRPLQTKKTWKKIDSVELMDAKKETVNLSIYKVPPNNSIIEDFKRDVTFNDTIETVFWSMDKRQNCAILQKRHERGRDILETLRSGGQTDVVQEFHLFDIDGQTKIDVIDFTIDPFTNYVYAIDNDFLYIYDKREEYSKKVKELPGDNGTADFVLEMEKDYLGLDENGEKEVLIKCIHRKPGTTIVKYRIIITKPDGTQFFLDKNGQVTTDLNAATILPTQNDIVLEPRQYAVTLDMCGEYIFELETLYRGGNTTRDKHIYIINKKAALIKYKLERIMDGADPLSIAYYADQKIKIFDTKNVLNSLVLHKDGVMIDYDDKVLYFIEDYDSVEVTS